MSHNKVVPATDMNDNLNVVTNSSQIYQGGKLSGITIAELVGNELAIRQIVNEIINLSEENRALRLGMNELAIKNAENRPKPPFVIISTIANVCGAVLIAIGTDYMGLKFPPNWSIMVLVIGVILVIVNSVLQSLPLFRRMGK